mgnify:CR=1 FL=1
MLWDARRKNMRYIGSKLALLDNIESVINENTTGKEQVFCDLFSGTASVAKHFKHRYEIISNDFLYFSYVIFTTSAHHSITKIQVKVLKMHMLLPTISCVVNLGSKGT